MSYFLAWILLICLETEFNLVSCLLLKNLELFLVLFLNECQTVFRNFRTFEKDVCIVWDNFKIEWYFFVSLNHLLRGIVQKGIFEIPTLSINVLFLQDWLQLFNRIVIKIYMLFLNLCLQLTYFIELFHCGIYLFTDLSFANCFDEIFFRDVFFEWNFFLKPFDSYCFFFKIMSLYFDIVFYDFDEFFVLFTQNCILFSDFNYHDDLGRYIILNLLEIM